MAREQAGQTADPQPKKHDAADQALRTIEEIRQLFKDAGPDDLAESAAAVREKLQAALHGFEEAAGIDASSIAGSIERGQQTVGREIEAAEEQIRANPIGSVIAAAGLGFLVGLLMRRGN